MLVPIFFLVSLYVAQTCGNSVEYSRCAETANLGIAACSSQVKGPVGDSLYTCLCDSNTKLLKCYDICPDDTQLQLQAESQRATVASSCVYAAAHPTNTTVTSTSMPKTTIVASTSSAFAPMTAPTFTSFPTSAVTTDVATVDSTETAGPATPKTSDVTRPRPQAAPTTRVPITPITAPVLNFAIGKRISSWLVCISAFALVPL